MKRGMFAILAVTVMLAVAVMPAVPNDSEASPSSWKYAVTINEDSVTTLYSINGSPMTEATAVNGITKSVGSWGFDSGGFGPFGSFYAAFDSSGTLVCHLDPYNLRKDIDGNDIPAGCNIMWCLPKHYVSVDNKTLVISSNSSDGDLAKAFVIEGKEYNYLAIGVYEATYDDDTGKLGSMSGKTPKSAISPDVARTAAQKNEVSSGIALLWNYHMVQTYRQCALAVIGNLDSQEQVGYGNVRGTSSTTTGQKDEMGPYYGKSSPDQIGVKCFIDDAWGSLSEYVDDAWWTEEGIAVGQNRTPTSDAKNKVEIKNKAIKVNTWGTNFSTNLDTWGLPTSAVNKWSKSAPDYCWCSQYGTMPMFGGHFCSGNDAGAGLFQYHEAAGGYGDVTFGSRMAFLFDNDPLARHTVVFEMDGGSPQIQSFSVQQGHEFTIPDTLPQKDGFSFKGWYDGETIYKPGGKFIMGSENIILMAIWGCLVTFDLNGGEWDLSNTVVVNSGTYTVPDAVPTKSGSAFKEWRCGNITIHPGDSMKLDSNVTLQAVWVSNSVPIIPGDEQDTVEVVIEKESEPWLGKDEKNILLIAVAVAIIAELAVLSISRKR